jgi:hypothetical protein
MVNGKTGESHNFQPRCKTIIVRETAVSRQAFVICVMQIIVTITVAQAQEPLLPGVDGGAAMTQRWDKTTVPAEFRGFYQGAHQNVDGLKCTQKDWGIRDEGLLIATTKVEGRAEERWGCDISNVSPLDDRYSFDADYNNAIVVDQVCSAEGFTQPIREVWSIKKAGQMILLIQTNAKTLTSSVWIRCRGR